MMKIGSYPKVLQLGHRYIADILNGNIVCEEKIDGSQISFGVINGELVMRSKGAQLHENDPNKMFTAGIDTIVALKDKLVDGCVFRGEYLQKPKHSTLAYDRVPHNHIILFDVETSPNNHVASPEEKSEIAKSLELECVPHMARPIKEGTDILPLLDVESCLGGPKIEGVVIKNYDRITPDGKFMVGKYVSEAFKERHGKEWKKANPGRNDIIQTLIMQLKTDARYEKAIQHVRERGELTESPQDIGRLLKELHVDLEAEEAEFIRDELYRKFIGNIKRGVCGGFAEWYKRLLLENVNPIGEEKEGS